MASTTADPRHATAAARFAMTLVTVAATLGGWLVMARAERPTPAATGTEAAGARLPPLPSLEPASTQRAAPRRPVPIATTRASR